MIEDQQEQARSTFNETADAWQRQSRQIGEYSLIHNRNAVVLGELSAYPSGTQFLDIGCGTGQLVVEAANRGYRATGIDYSNTMIKYCLENARDAQVAAEFELASIFDTTTNDREYQLISALGFIEYLPQAQLDNFFKKVADMLAGTGRFLVGTRNRLFNVTSLNEFTDIEIKLGNFENLVRQSMAFQSVKASGDDLEFLDEFAGIEPQPDTHPNTGVKVDTRYQYSPGEISSRLQAGGYHLDSIYPVHYHAFPPSFKNEHLAEHERTACFVQERASTDMRLIPWCSTLIFSASRVT
jgi:SAM-dependent methyltransferase